MAVQTDTAAKAGRKGASAMRAPKRGKEAGAVAIPSRVTWTKNRGESSGHTLWIGRHVFDVNRNAGPAAGGVCGRYLYVDQPTHRHHHGPIFAQASNRAELVEALERLIAAGAAAWAEERIPSDVGPDIQPPAALPPLGGSDDELIRLAGYLEEQEAAYAATFRETETPAMLARQAAALDASVAAAARMDEIPAKTMVGAAAKARAARAAADPAGEKKDYVTTLVWGAAEDLVRLAEGGAAADAALIEACRQHKVTRDAYNRDGGILEPENDPLWAAYATTRDAVGASAHSIAGLVAKARAAVEEATCTVGGVTTVNPENSPAADYAWEITNDMIRLFGDAPSPAAPTCPVQRLLPDFASAHAEDERWANTVPTNKHCWEKTASQAAYDRMEALWDLLPTVRPTSSVGALLSILGAARLVAEVEDFIHEPEKQARILEVARTLLSSAYYVFETQHDGAPIRGFRDLYLSHHRYPHASPAEFAAAMGSDAEVAS